MTDRQRQAFDLRQSGCSLREIADALNLRHVQNVSLLLRRARQSHRDAIASARELLASGEITVNGLRR